MNRVLIIDDNEKLCMSLKRNFDQRGYFCEYANNSADALHNLNSSNYSLILLDVVFGAENGIELLPEILKIDSTLPIIVITGFATIESAVKAIKRGAYDYIQKPLNFEKLLILIENAIKMSKLQKENIEYKRIVKKLSPQLITKNEEMIKLYENAANIASTEIPILIQGENGTGKELLADFIHSSSKHSASEMIKINCAAFPENLLDNELFGHEKGAFTGAASAYKGVFERAHKSTLMLDEIGDMEMATQAKILRAIQNKEINRIGGYSTIKVDVRFIAATNKNLKNLIDKNEFRNDLFYRLNAATLHLPPLRKRKEDVPLLVDHFLKEFSAIGDKTVSSISSQVMESFMNYDWPGNIRELKNALMYGAALSRTSEINIKDLPVNFDDLNVVAPDDDLLQNSEKAIILKVLKSSQYNKKKTAELLNISRRTLYNKLEKYGIDL